MAVTFTEIGLDRQTVIEHLSRHQSPWDKDLVKSDLFGPIMYAKYGKRHTSDLTKTEVQVVFKIMQRFLKEQYDLDVEFPSFQQMIEAYKKRRSAFKS